MTTHRSRILFVGIAIVAAILGALLARNVLNRGASAPALASGTLLRPSRPVSAFSLIDQNSAPFTNSALQNQWTLMFFGFTNCGDICPTTLTLLASVAKSVADLPSAQRPQVVFVSVDANRDTPSALQRYLRHFDSTFVGVTGTQPALDAFTLSLGVPSAIRPLASGYAVDHSASILAFNPQGEFQALFSAPHTVDALVKDYRVLAGMRP